MARGTTPKLIGFGIVVAVVSLVLTGCATAVGNVSEQLVHSAAVMSRETGVSAYKPAAGDCWKATFNGDLKYADWSTKPPVPCSEPHQLYTFAVLQLKLPHSGSAYSNGLEKTSVHDDAENTCQSYQNRQYGDAPELDGLLKLKTFIPRNAQWDIGARWVRCDFNVFAVGSSITNPKLEDLPAFWVIRNQLASDGTLFDYCINNPNSTPATGPKAPGAVYAACGTDPQWTLKSYMAPDFMTTSGFPTPAEFDQMYQQQCVKRYASADRYTYAYFPTKSQWDDGLIVSECWAGHAS